MCKCIHTSYYIHTYIRMCKAYTYVHIHTHVQNFLALEMGFYNVPPGVHGFLHVCVCIHASMPVATHMYVQAPVLLLPIHAECGMEAALEEVDKAIQRLFFYGAYADKYGGSVQETSLYGATVRIHEPVGTLGIACPDEFPLLGFVSLFAPAVIRGNTIVIIPSEAHPLSATDLYQVFDTSDLPGGVVNIVTGNKDHLTKYLVEHQVSHMDGGGGDTVTLVAVGVLDHADNGHLLS